MSENEEAFTVGIAVGNDVVPIYRVTLVREPTVVESLRTAIRKSSEAAEIVRPLFASLDREQFVVLLLDAKHCPIAVNTVSIGSLTATVVHPRLCFAKHNLGYVAAAVMWRSARSS